MRALLAAALLAGCATTPTTIHNGTLPNGGWTVELGGLYSPSQELDDVSSETAEKTKQSGEKSGFVGLLQVSGAYMKIDSAPLPGAWFGFGLTDPKPGRFGWYPAVEITGSRSSSSQEKDEKKDGFITDDDGNRYLYEITEQSGGFGIASPQVFEVYPIKRFGLHFAVIPAYLHEYTTREVDIPYEKDKRFIQADPELDAEYKDIVTREEQRKTYNRYAMPVLIGARAQLGPFQWRLAYNYRGLDSKKDFEHTFKDAIILTFAYVHGHGAPSPSFAKPPVAKDGVRGDR